MKIEIYSDVACPWCYIGERRLNRALAAFPQGDQVEVVFRPYQLDPNAPEAAAPLAQYLERRFGRRVDRMLDHVSAAAAGEGITIAWDKTLAVNTRNAHRLLRLAEQEHGAVVQRALAERLFDLYFSRGGNLADIDQLAAAADSVGMDAGRVRAHLGTDEGVRELEAEFGKARSLGIHAVPTFVINDRYIVEGAQPAPKFLEVLDEAGRIEASASASNDESCADGVCST